MPRDQIIVQAKGLRKVYKIGTEKVVALDSIDLEIQRGEICCILGTSGSGKSTLLNLIVGLEKPTKGVIRLAGTEIQTMSEKKLALFRQAHVGFVFQAYNLLPVLTALENVAMPLMFKGIGKKERLRRAKAMLTQVGLADRMYHKPTQMSGGQQQRVAIARAFVSRPEIVFADEPTGNLDSHTTLEIMRLMLGMAEKYKQTLVIVTHDRTIAEYAGRVVHILDGNVESDTSTIERNTSNAEEIIVPASGDSSPGEFLPDPVGGFGPGSQLHS